MSDDEKQGKIDLLTKLQTSISKTCMNLSQNGEEVHVNQLEQVNMQLSVAIEELIQKSLGEWNELSKNFVTKEELNLKSVKISLDEINQNLKDSKKIAKNVGQIDKAIKSVLKQIT